MYTYHVCTAKRNEEFVREYGTVSPRPPRRAMVMLYSSSSEDRDQPKLGMAAADKTDIIKIQRTQLFENSVPNKKAGNF